MKIKKDDTVKIITGKDKGVTGKVLRVIPKLNKVVVENANIVKRHQRPNQQMKDGGIIEQPAAIHASKVMVVCSSCGNPTRVGYKTLEDGKKVRFCRKCNEVIDKA